MWSKRRTFTKTIIKIHSLYSNNIKSYSNSFCYSRIFLPDLTDAVKILQQQKFMYKNLYELWRNQKLSTESHSISNLISPLKQEGELFIIHSPCQRHKD